MGNLHGKAPTQKICPQKNSLRAVKFNFFSSWAINGPEIPILGCIVYYRDRGRCATPPHKKSPAETGLMELRRNRRDSKETPQTIDFPGIVARKCPASKRGQGASVSTGSFVPRRLDNPRKLPRFRLYAAVSP